MIEILFISFCLLLNCQLKSVFFLKFVVFILIFIIFLRMHKHKNVYTCFKTTIIYYMYERKKNIYNI